MPARRSDAALDRLSIDTIRTLAIDAIQTANSGHPGTVMAMAPVVYELWQRFLRFDPDDPIWPNRDRFVLSAGHASMLLYALLHLARVKAVDPDYETLGECSVKLEDIERFRQLDSRAAGHPEYRWTSGVETTTGPLGQGVGTSVGMAIASSWLGARFNRPGFELFDFDVYVVASDGDLMEGISYEAASIAGHLRLEHLCWIYDNNRITIDGSTSLAFSDDVATRFMGQGWNVTRVSDANDLDMVSQALETFRHERERPTLIIVDSHIGYGAPGVQDTAAAHGEPLGEEQARLAKRSYGWPEDSRFLIPDGVVEHFAAGSGSRGRELRERWQHLFERYRAEHPELADAIERMQRRELPDGWDAGIPAFDPDPKGIATRKASGEALNAVARRVPWLVGGAADLTGSTGVGLAEDAGTFTAEDRGGRYLHFGVREHGMTAIVNGLSLSKLRPFGATYLIFSDYAREPIRLSAIMEIPAIWIFTHDSIGVGEDGPTHQPVEQLASLRATPGLVTMRPCDANETAEAWRVLMRLQHSPAALVLTRQAVPTLDRSRYAPASGLERGAYVLADPEGGEPELILIGTGSEVQLCIDAYEQLTAEGERVRAVSMPSWELFDQQPREYREAVLPPAVRARVSVEQASTLGWDRFVGPGGATIGMHTFGASAPLKDVQRKLGFTRESVVAHVPQAARVVPFKPARRKLMQLGMCGLGRMGANIVRRLMRGGHECVVYDVNPRAVEELVAEGAVGASSLDDFVARLSKPRAAWVMVPVAFTGEAVEGLAARMEKGDVLIDGGNSYYRDDLERAQSLARKGIQYVDVGTSGGVLGLERGFCLMIGGPGETVERLDPIFRTLAPGIEQAPRTAGREGEPTTAEQGYLHCGPAGAGHFVKMVHNGIEYGLMAAYAEGFNVLRHANVGKQEGGGGDAETTPLRDPRHYQYDIDLPAVAEVWRRGSVVASWLLDLTAAALAASPDLHEFAGRVSDSGEGRWTVMAAVEEGVPASVLTTALYERFSSRGEADFANQLLSAMRAQFGGHVEKPAGG